MGDRALGFGYGGGDGYMVVKPEASEGLVGSLIEPRFVQRLPNSTQRVPPPCACGLFRHTTLVPRARYRPKFDRFVPRTRTVNLRIVGQSDAEAERGRRLEGSDQYQAPKIDFIRTSMVVKYSKSMNIISHLDHMSHCITASGTS